MHSRITHHNGTVASHNINKFFPRKQVFLSLLISNFSLFQHQCMMWITKLDPYLPGTASWKLQEIHHGLQLSDVSLIFPASGIHSFLRIPIFPTILLDLALLLISRFKYF